MSVPATAFRTQAVGARLWLAKDRLMRSRMSIVWSLWLAVALAGCGTNTQPASQPAAKDGAIKAAQPIATASAVASGAAAKKLARGNLHFVEGYRQGFELATRENRPMLLFFTAEWCHFCHQMADEVFTNEQIVGLSERFVCILVDADAEPEVCRQFRVQGYPTLQFLSPRGVPLNQLVGKKPAHQVMVAMQAALQNVARRSSGGDAPTLR